MKITVKINPRFAGFVHTAARNAAAKTVEAIKTDVVTAQVMPFDTGAMQNGGTYATGTSVSGNKAICVRDDSETVVYALTNDAPQARRLYYHPEYDFQTVHNPKAGGYWLEDWIWGQRSRWVCDICRYFFAEEMRRL